MLSDTLIADALAPRAPLALAQTTATAISTSNANATATVTPSNALDWNLTGRAQVEHPRFGGVCCNDGASHSATHPRRARLSGSLRWHEECLAALSLETDDSNCPALDTALITLQPRRLLNNSEFRLGCIDREGSLHQTMNSACPTRIERSAIWAGARPKCQVPAVSPPV